MSIGSKTNKPTQNNNPIIGQIDKAVFKKAQPNTHILEVEGWFLNSLEPLVALQLGMPGSQMVLAVRGPLNNFPSEYDARSYSENSTFKASIPLLTQPKASDLVHFLATLADGVTLAGGLQIPDQIRVEVVQPQNYDYKTNIEFQNYIALQKSKLNAFLNSKELLTFIQHDKPDVSIIIPLFNRAELTLECLRSVKQTQGLTYEVILVDNGSLDQTKDLIKQLVGVKVITNQTNQHFINACNQGAEFANGNTILFLNSDTWVSTFSIYSAWQTLQADSAIGAVGGRIVGLNGKIQESGSIIYADGSAEGYGRGLASENSQVMFSREVDFVSGAFLLTRTNIFLASGKFDLAYYPAYYEDVDYCLRMWDMGYKVVYEPKAYVVHVENASANSEFAKAYQLINRKTLLSRVNPKYFTKNPTNTSLETRSASQSKFNKTVLVIDDQIPISAKGSGFPRMVCLLNSLVELECRVCFFPTQASKESWLEIYSALSPKIEVIKDCGQNGLLQFLLERQDYFDSLIVSRPQNIEIVKDLKRKQPNLRLPNYIIYDVEAITATRELAKLEVTKNIVTSSRDKRYVLAKELDLYISANKLLSVSENEASIIRSFGYSNVEILSHALGPQLTDANYSQRNTILSLGPIYEVGTPNHYATEKFVNVIWPTLKHQLGEKYKFCHIGKCNAAYFFSNSNEATEFVGPVDDLRLFFSKAVVFVACHEYSAGIPIKCLEAASYGVPCVITEHLAKQLGWQDGKEALVAKDTSDFASKVKILCSDFFLWESVRKAAFKHVQDNYSKQKFIETLNRVINNQPDKFSSSYHEQIGSSER